jgi:cephalosporin-C deacetylase
MPSIDLPLDRLREYKPPLYPEKDFDSFWSETIEAASRQPLNVELTPYDLPARGVECFSVRFDGFADTSIGYERPGRIAGWYVRPTGAKKSPGVVMYHGYSGRGARPLDMLATATQGIAVLSMDVRGQTGESEDFSGAGGSGHFVGYMTKGIAEPRHYYYRYVYADALRALDVLTQRDEVDERRIAVTGGSQGGGISLAVAALANERVSLCLPDVAFLCDFRRAIEITPDGPYPEITRYIKQNPSAYTRVMRTLSYFDNLNLAPRIRCRTLASVGLCDTVCPPSTIFAVLNHITAEKEIEVYPYHAHEWPYEHREVQHRALVEGLF